MAPYYDFDHSYRPRRPHRGGDDGPPRGGQRDFGSRHGRYHRYDGNQVHDYDSPAASRDRRNKKWLPNGINWSQVAAAAATAGAVQALHSRHRKDEKVHVATAAAASAAVDAAVGSKRDEKSGRHVIQSTIVGLVVDRLLNGKGKVS